MIEPQMLCNKCRVERARKFIFNTTLPWYHVANDMKLPFFSSYKVGQTRSLPSTLKPSPFTAIRIARPTRPLSPPKSPQRV